MFHSVYCSYESCPNGRNYLGKHSSHSPYDDYLGSYKDPYFSPDSKIVLAYATSPEGAIWLEMMFQRVFDVVEDPQYANRAYQTSVGFDTTGLSAPKTDEHRAKISQALSGEKHPQFGKPGTRLGATTPQEVRERISKTLTGHQRSSESKEKQSKSVSGPNNPLYGKRGSEHPSFGLKWWFNPSTNESQKSRTCPGPDWRRGRK